jgi:hypothetical protein
MLGYYSVLPVFSYLQIVDTLPDYTFLYPVIIVHSSVSDIS